MKQATGVGNHLVICAQLHRISTDCPDHNLQKMQDKQRKQEEADDAP